MGQGELWLYWAYDDGETFTSIRRIVENGWAVFHRTGREFATEKWGYVNRYDFPSCE